MSPFHVGQRRGSRRRRPGTARPPGSHGRRWRSPGGAEARRCRSRRYARVSSWLRPRPSSQRPSATARTYSVGPSPRFQRQPPLEVPLHGQAAARPLEREPADAIRPRAERRVGSVAAVRRRGADRDRLAFLDQQLQLERGPAAQPVPHAGGRRSRGARSRRSRLPPSWASSELSAGDTTGRSLKSRDAPGGAEAETGWPRSERRQPVSAMTRSSEVPYARYGRSSTRLSSMPMTAPKPSVSPWTRFTFTRSLSEPVGEALARAGRRGRGSRRSARPPPAARPCPAR